MALHKITAVEIIDTSTGKTYKKLRTDYKKALEKWVDLQHGVMIDKILAKV